MEHLETSASRSNVRRYAIPTALLLAIAAACLWQQLGRRAISRPLTGSTPRIAPLPSSPYRNTDPSVAYVGDDACVQCHAEIARTYRQHPMGRSMSPVPGEDPKAEGIVFKVKDLVYSVIHRDGRVVHREEQRDANGRTVVTAEAEVRFMLGSGQRGLAFLVGRGDGLFQSPIAWYTADHRWALPPLFDVRNLHFDRPVRNGCLFCHSSRTELSATERPAQFHGLPIGCESCHGPGALHAKRQDVVDGRDWTIVNPADLEPRSLRESVCEQCHLQGSGRKDQPGRSVFDYRPGLPFDAFVAVSYALGDPISSRRAVGHVEQMRQSRCYQESAGELGCISCHDPHRLPPAEERVSYYQSRCLECHSQHPCSLPRERRIAQNSGDDCTACHMPRSASSDIAHAAVTVHSIPRHLPSPP